MPISYRVDHARRVVFARGVGTLTDEDVFGYQRELWSRNDVAGFDELMDMSAVEAIQPPSPQRIRELAELAAHMDPRGGSSRFAIAAPATLAFGLGKMFQAQRDAVPRSTKEVGVFRTIEEALAFLGLDRIAPEKP